MIMCSSVGAVFVLSCSCELQLHIHILGGPKK